MTPSPGEPSDMTPAQGQLLDIKPGPAEPPNMKPPAGQPPPGQLPDMKPPPGQPPDMKPPPGQPPGELPAMKSPVLPGFISASTSGVKRTGDQLDSEMESDSKRQNTNMHSAEETKGAANENEEMLTMRLELDRLREENDRLKLARPEMGLPCGSTALFEDEIVTKGQIKRMKLEAKEVLNRPIADGFGFKMLEKMGWKQGEGLGNSFKGITEPIWVAPREGKAGLCSAESGEYRPGPAEVEDARISFVREGEVVPTSTGLMNAGALVGHAGRGLMQAAQQRPMPTVRSVMPAVFRLSYMAAAPPVSEGGNHDQSHQVFSVLGDVLAEVLDGAVGDRFLHLLDERLGPQVAAQISEMRKSRMVPGSDSEVHATLEPLWQLTRHHVPRVTDADNNI